MVVSLKEHFATDKRPLNYCLENFPKKDKSAERLIKYLSNELKLDKNKKILEIGAAQGSLLISFALRGYHCEGIEPSDDALKTAKKLSDKFKQSIIIKKGFAENIPYEDNTFDVVIAISVLEHVSDINKTFNEICRVLKRGGYFYFSTASCLCPKQYEIRFFPFFSWYPQGIKLKIIKWSKNNKPSLVGYTTTPAINWFSPWKTKKLLDASGLKLKYDRWDMAEDILDDDLTQMKRILIRIIRLNKITKFFGDVIIPDCIYLAYKK
jgi:ubiquinone/menaquinone biosynthesis C-methylase UbiE